MSIRKELSLKLFIGFLTGSLAGILMTTYLTSLGADDGMVYCYVPELAEAVGDNLLAFTLTVIVSGLYGMAGVGCTIFYSFEKWSLLKATVLHFLVPCGAFYITGFILRWWSPCVLADNLFMLGFFVLVYFIIWIANYYSLKGRIRRINRKMMK